MVGKRIFGAKTRPSLALERVVGKTNFYRRVKQILNPDFLYEEVKPYYGLADKNRLTQWSSSSCCWQAILRISILTGPLLKAVS
jgi:hypothetical protein